MVHTFVGDSDSVSIDRTVSVSMPFVFGTPLTATLFHYGRFDARDVAPMTTTKPIEFFPA